ncbi:MAG: iron-sulfur cluster co-chaperone HscB C-terminal domain-containing protein [Planctomycetota bacterium]|nr:iron-sulfur cluster co-chaperone HscB C-terminal domain-containing protein [Planctomycetota bacterium]
MALNESNQLKGDPFELLGVPARFDLDSQAIRRAYLARTQEAHPDRAGLDAQAEGVVAAVNEARRILDDPESRATALLRRVAPDATEWSKSPPLPPEFLMEVMEIREEVDRAIADRDGEALQKWLAWAEDRRAASVDEARAGFAAGDRASHLKIFVTLSQWRYVERLKETIRGAMGELGIKPRVANSRAL